MRILDELAFNFEVTMAITTSSIKAAKTKKFNLVFIVSRLMNSGVTFSRAVLLCRGASGLASSVNFFQNGLGLTVLRHTDDWAELVDRNSSDGNCFRINLKAVESEAQLSTGYNQILQFEVTDLDSTVTRCVQLGAQLDGPIIYPAHGKVSTMRTNEGHMIGIYEPNS